MGIPLLAKEGLGEVLPDFELQPTQVGQVQSPSHVEDHRVQHDTWEILAAVCSGDLVGYAELDRLPTSGGVYTAWLDGHERCLYVGQGSSLRKRIRSHFSGERGSDQFCLYVYDRYVHSTRGTDLTTAEVNRLTAHWIRTSVRFRWAAAPDPELRALETQLRQQLRPILNPL